MTKAARKGRRDVADDDDGKDQNQSPEVAYQRHKLPAGIHLSFYRGHLAGDLSQIGEIDHQTGQNYQRDHGQDEKADVLPLSDMASRMTGKVGRNISGMCR